MSSTVVRPRSALSGNLSTVVLGSAIVVLAIAATLANPRFVSTENLVNILVQTSYLSIFTLAQAIPLITRGFDLSLGTTVSAVSLVTAVAVGTGLPYGAPSAIALGLLAGLACGVLVGTVNGLLIAFAGLNPFIVTLGVWNVLGGIVALLSGGFPVPVDPVFGSILSQASVVGLPVPVLAGFAIVVLAWWLLERRTIGRKLFLVGANPKATAVAGVSNRSVIMTAYVLCSGIAALGAVLLTARTGSGEPNLGGALTLQSIAAAVIGGISLRGGEGRFYGPALGALFITVLTSALNFLRVESYLQMVVLGIVIVASVCVDQYRRY